MLVIESTDKKIIEELCASMPEEAIITNSYPLDGNEIFRIIIEITQIAAPLIAAFIIANRERNTITIRRKGIEITSKLSNKKLNDLDIIRKLLTLEKEEDSPEEE